MASTEFQVGQVKDSNSLDFIARERSSRYVAFIEQILALKPTQSLELTPQGHDREGNAMTVEKLRMHVAAAQRNSPHFQEKKNPLYKYMTRTTKDGNVAIECKLKTDTNSGGDAAKEKLKAMQAKAGNK